MDYFSNVDGVTYFARLARAGIVSFLGTLEMAFAVEGREYFNLYRDSAVWDLISAGMGAPLAVVAARSFEGRPRAGLSLLLAVFVSYVLISDLRPFELGPRKPLSVEQLIPLIYPYLNPDVMALSNILEAVVVYAPVRMLIYLIRLHRNGTFAAPERWPPLRIAGLPCAALASLTEIAQLWIPTRTACVEDILYAAIGGCVGASAARLDCEYTAGDREEPHFPLS